MPIRHFLLPLLFAAASLWSADYAHTDTDALLALRSKPLPPQERRDLENALRGRLKTMSEAQLERYMTPGDAHRKTRSGMGDGKIATH